MCGLDRVAVVFIMACAVGAAGCGKRSEDKTRIERRGNDGSPVLELAHPDDLKRDPPADARRPEPKRHTWSGDESDAIDRARVDPMVFLPRAQQSARDKWADAKLLNLQYVAVDPGDGTCSLSERVTNVHGTIAYGFRRGFAPARGADECIYWVFIDHEKVYDETHCGTEHRLPGVVDRAMRCTVRQVLKRVAASNGEATGRVDLVHWRLQLHNGKVRGVWRVSGYPAVAEDGRTTSVSTQVVDDCE